MPATGSTAVSASKPSAAGPSKPASVRTAPVKALVGPMLPPVSSAGAESRISMHSPVYGLHKIRSSVLVLRITALPQLKFLSIQLSVEWRRGGSASRFQLPVYPNPHACGCTALILHLQLRRC